jgi:hypothetical protein
MRARDTALILSCAFALAGCAAGDESEDLDFRGTDHATEAVETTHAETGAKETEETGAKETEETGTEEDTGEGNGCTRTQGFWKTHNIYARNPSQLIPWPISEDTMLCGSTWLEWLRTQPRGDAWIILVHQWIAAQLNVASGADAPDAIDDAIADAGTLLASCSISADLRDDALALSELLDSFNNGNEGVDHCE